MRKSIKVTDVLKLQEPKTLKAGTRLQCAGGMIYEPDSWWKQWFNGFAGAHWPPRWCRSMNLHRRLNRWLHQSGGTPTIWFSWGNKHGWNETRGSKLMWMWWKSGLICTWQLGLGELLASGGFAAVKLSHAGSVNLLQKVNAAQEPRRCARMCSPVASLSKR